MNVTLVSTTVPLANPGDSLIQQVADLARVSVAPEHQRKSPEKLVRYLIDHKHWSPFEMVNVCMEIRAPRDISRQILRHRSFSFQELSQRYSDPLEILTMEPREPRKQHPTNRQLSVPLDASDHWLFDEWMDDLSYIMAYTRNTYGDFKNQGIAKEVLRVMLPEGLTMSRMYVNGTLRSWMHYCDVRTGEDTQKEHREIAKECKVILDSLLGFDYNNTKATKEEDKE
jgi:thymidylate synthase (FAD)